MTQPNRWIIALDRLANTTFGPLMVHTWLAARRAGSPRPGRRPGADRWASPGATRASR